MVEDEQFSKEAYKSNAHLVGVCIALCHFAFLSIVTCSRMLMVLAVAGATVNS